MSLGTGAAETALYFPVRDFWATTPAQSTPEAQANDDAALELESHQVDFDFADDDLLRPENVSGGALHIGKMSYRTLVITQTRMMPDRTALALARFVRTGGTLVAVGSLPDTGPVRAARFSRSWTPQRPG